MVRKRFGGGIIVSKSGQKWLNLCACRNYFLPSLTQLLFISPDFRCVIHIYLNIFNMSKANTYVNILYPLWSAMSVVFSVYTYSGAYKEPWQSLSWMAIFARYEIYNCLRLTSSHCSL